MEVTVHWPRSSQTRTRVEEELLAHEVLVLTIDEAKGLEFDAVFIVDFFTESPFKRWAVVTEVHILALEISNT